eukprot:4908234-Prorocentrum_lima.AAC.1
MPKPDAKEGKGGPAHGAQSPHAEPLRRPRKNVPARAVVARQPFASAARSHLHFPAGSASSRGLGGR